MSQQLSRRQFGALALTGIGSTFLLSACGTSATPSGASSPRPVSTAAAFAKATLNFAFWTNPVRTAYTNKSIQNYMDAHPKITVNQAPGEWATYWTKLSTQVAGQTEPDIIQMDQAYIAEYGGRGALLDLRTVGTINTKPLKSTLGEGVLNGKIYGIPTGNNAYAVIANKTLFKKAGVELPDDNKWTWDDYLAISKDLADGSNGAFTGTSWFASDSDLQIWLHQHGQQLYTDKGKLGFRASTLASWFAFVQKLFESGGGPTPDQFTTDITASLQQTLFGTGKAAMYWTWSNGVTAYQQASSGDCVLLRPPSQAGSALKNGVYYKPSQYWSIGSQTKYPQQAGALINYFLNNISAARLELAERGVPANPKVLETITPLLSATDRKGIDYMKEIADEIKWVPPVPPMGTGTVQAVAQRYASDVVFGRATPSQAASQFKKEVQALVSAAA